MEKKVIYLTGAPAAGKSNLCKLLKNLFDDLLIFEYGFQMATHIESVYSDKSPISQYDLRAGIENYVTISDIDAVDDHMINFVKSNRERYNIIIDSHHVTKETYGFAASVFSPQKLIKLNITEIWVLYTSSDTTISRIKQNSGGRPLVTNFEADMHTYLQADLALIYATQSGIQTHFFDSDVDSQKLLAAVKRRLA